MSHIFISYSRRDLNFAQKIVDALATNNLDTWIDWKSIPKGEDWEQEIYCGIEEADAFLFLISPDSVKSEMCNNEIEHAVKNGKRILPIVTRDADSKSIHPDISKLNWVFCRDGQDDFYKAIEETRKTIHTDYEWLKYHTSLQVKALKWEQKNDSSRLLRGKELAEAEERLAAGLMDPAPTELQRQFVLGGRQHENQQRRRLTIGLTMGLMALLGIAIFAIVQWQRAEQQTRIVLARQLAAEAQSIFATGNSKQMTAVLLATQSMQLSPSADAAQILQTNKLADLVVHITHEQRVSSVVFSRDGYYVASGGCDQADDEGVCVQGSVRVWNAQTGEELSRITQYGGISSSVAFSPDGHFVAFGSSEGSAWIWDIRTGRKVSYATHEFGVYTVVFSPDGRYVASGGCDQMKDGFCRLGLTRVWDVLTGREVARMDHNAGVSSIIFSSDGRYIATACSYNDSTVRIWDVGTEQEVANMIHDGAGWVSEIAFSPDDHYVVSAGNWDDTARVWDAQTGQEIARMTHDGNVSAVAFSPDGHFIVSGGSDRTARVWDAQTGNEISRMDHNSLVSTVAFSPDGNHVVTGSYDGTARVWKTATGQEVARITHESLVSSISISHDGHYIATVGCEDLGDGGYCQLETAGIWDVSAALLDSQGAMEIVRMNYGWGLRTFAFSPDGHYIAAGGDGPAIFVWDVTTGRQISKLETGGSVVAVGFSMDSRHVLARNSEAGVQIWDISTGNEIPHDAYDDTVSFAVFSPDGRYIASKTADGTIRVWDLDSRNDISRIVPDNSVSSISFSADGRYMATNSQDSIIQIWDVNDGEEVGQILTAIPVSSIIFSPNRRYILADSCVQVGESGSCTLSDVRVWSIGSGKEVARMTHNGYVSFADFSPNGRYVASVGTDDQTMVVWSATTGQEITRMPQDNFAISVAFSPDGNHVLSAGCGQREDAIFAEFCSSGVVRVWQTLTGQEVVRMDFDSLASTAIFSPDGRFLVSDESNGIVHVWYYHPEDMIAETCSRVTRNLTRLEWQQFIGNTMPYQAVCPNLPIEPEITIAPIP